MVLEDHEAANLTANCTKAKTTTWRVGVPIQQATILRYLMQENNLYFVNLGLKMNLFLRVRKLLVFVEIFYIMRHKFWGLCLYLFS